MAREPRSEKAEESPLAVALRQAGRERRRGDFRRAMLLLKGAAFEAADQPGVWTRYALACMSTGKSDEAHKAFAQAVWLQERRGHQRGAAVTKQLAELAESGNLPSNYCRSQRPNARGFALPTNARLRTTTQLKQDSWHPYHKSRSRKSRES